MNRSCLSALAPPGTGASWPAQTAPVLAVLLPLVGFAIWAAEFLWARPHIGWTLVLVTATACALALSIALVRGRLDVLLDRLEAQAAPISLGFMATAAAFLVTLNFLQARFYALGPHAEDTAYYSQILWNTIQGDFLVGSVQQERLYNPPVTNDLGLHVSPLLLITLLPAYWAIPHYLTLLIVRDLALTAAAWPLFLIVRDRLGGAAGVAATALYLLSPVVMAQGAEAFYLLQFAPLPFFFALLAFEQAALGRFLTWSLIALSVREDVAIALAGFGLYALVRRRPWHWWALGLGVPAAWWAAATMLVQPRFGRWANSAFDIALAGGAPTPLGAYQSFFANPSWLWAVLHEGGGEYVYRLLRQTGFLPLLGLDGLLAAPSILANLFAGRAIKSTLDAGSRFALLPVCALLGAAVSVSARVVAFLAPERRQRRAFALVVLVLLPAVSLVDGLKDAVQARLGSYTVWNDAQSLSDALALVPSRASVAAPGYVLPALSQRKQLYYLQYLHQYQNARPEYVLVDRDVNRVSSNPDLRSRYLALVAQLLRSQEHTLIWQRGAYLLFRRNSPAS